MKVLDVERDGLERAVDEAVKVFKDGGIVVYPTETVYGLGAVFSLGNVKRVNVLKGRDPLQPVILLILPHMLDELVYVGKRAKELVKKVWPGPTTLLLPSKDGSLPWRYLGVRHSPEPFVENLLRKLGKPIISTSANMSGERPLEDPYRIVATFRDKVDLVVLRGKRSGKPSRILKVEGDKVEVVRD